MKVTHSKTANRRSHHRAGTVALVKTATGVRRMHFVDPVTGMYRGKQILTVVGKTPVVVAKKTAKKVAAKAAPKAETKVKKEKADTKEKTS